MKKRKVGTLLAGLMLVSAMALPVSAADGGNTEVTTNVPEEWTLTIPLDTEIPYNRLVNSIDGNVFVKGNIAADKEIVITAVHTSLYENHTKSAEDVNKRNEIPYTLSSKIKINPDIGSHGFQAEWNDLKPIKTEEFNVPEVYAIPTETLKDDPDLLEVEFTELGTYNSLMCYLNTLPNSYRYAVASQLTATIDQEEWDDAMAGKYSSIIMFEASEVQDENQGGSGKPL